MPSWKKLVTSGSNAVLNHVTASGNVSGSSTSTGSFGRVQTSVLGGNSPLIIDADNLKLDASGTLSGSSTSVGSFGQLKTANNFIVNSNGRVGINTTSPDYKLDVSGNIGMNEYLFHNGDSDTYLHMLDDRLILFAGGDNILDYEEDASSTLKIAGGGEADVTIGDSSTLFIGGSQGSYDAKVGIGTSSPQLALHVVGDIDLEDSAPFIRMKETGGNADMQFKLQTNGRMSLLNDNAATEVLTALQSGNIGIGETSPDTKLHISDDSDVYLTLESTNASTNEEVALKYSNAATSTNYWWVGLNQSDDYSLAYGTSFSGANTRFLVTETGNVGIGTTSPGKKLVVETTTDYDGIEVRDVNAVARIANGSADDGYIQLLKANVGKVQIHSSGATYFTGGSVGIGTTSPSTKLHVEGGDLRVSGDQSSIHLRSADYEIATISNVGSGGASLDEAYFDLLSAGTTKIRFRSDGSDNYINAGNLGIGTTSPSHKLDVSGDALVTGNLYIGSSNSRFFEAASNVIRTGDRLDVTGGILTNSVSNYTNQTLTLGNASYTMTIASSQINVNNGDILLNPGLNVSGSSTSTGSFGHLVIADNSTTFKNLNIQNLNVAQTVSASAFHANMSADAGSPEFSFGQDPDTGMYSGGANVLGFSTAGTVRFTLTSAAFSSQTTGGARITPTNGVAAGPAFTFNDDPDTGMFRAAANQLAFSTAGSERVRIDASGNVGIGVSDPDSPLEIYNSTDAQIKLSISTHGDAGILNGNADGLMIYGKGASNQIRFYSNTTEKMRVDGTGVGIGTTSPGSSLDVAGEIRGQKFAFNDDTNTHIDTFAADQIGFTLGANQAVKWAYVAGAVAQQFMYGASATYPSYTFNSDQDTGMFNATSNAIGFSTGGSEKMRINASGNLGIGTTSPSAKLHVDGDAIVTGKITAQEFHTEFVSASIQFESGSTKFGDTPADDTHQFTGSLNVTGSATITEALRLGSGGMSNVYDSNLVITSPAPAIFLDDSDVGTLRHSIVGGSNAGLDIGADIHNQATGYINFSVGGSTVVRFAEGGNVGIGTTNIGYRLDVEEGTGNEIARFQGANSGNIVFRNSTSNEFIMYTGPSDALIFGTGGNNERMRIAADGKVGIGMTPTHNFNLRSAGNVEFRIQSTDDDARLQISSDTDEGQDSILEFLSATTTRGSILYDHNTTAASQKMDFKVGDNAVTAMTILGSGNVGIGTTSPAGKLQVAGDIIIAQGSKLKEPDGNAYISFDSSYHITGSSAGDIVFDIDNNGNETNSFFRITKDNQATELMRVQEDGTVGIGTSSPTSLLHIQKASSSDTDFTNTNNPEAHHGILLNNNRFEAGSFTAITMNTANGSSVNGVSIIAQSAASGHAGKMIFARRALSSTVESMRIDESGNIGIGYTSPANKLSVSGVISSGNGTGVGIAGTPSDSNTSEIGPGYINLGRDDTANAKQITFGKNGAVHSYIETTTSGLNIGGANVGIGTTSPAMPLHIVNASGGRMMLHRSVGDSTSLLGSIMFGANDADTNLAMIASYHDGAKDSANIVFETEATGGSMAERMRITSAGNVGIGATSPDAPLHVNRTGGNAVAMFQTNTATPTINLKASTTDTNYLPFIKLSGNELQVAGGGIASHRPDGNTDIGHITFVSGSISGSHMSTGSFGKLIGDGSGLTGVTSTAGAAGNQYNVQFNSNGSATAGSDNFVFNSSNNRVGIGTSSPTRALTLAGSDFSSTSINLNRSDSGTHSDSAIVFEAQSTAATGVALGGFWFKNAVDDTTNAILRVRTDNGAGTSGRFEFVTGTGLNNNSTPSMVIKGGGWVGIKTTNPLAPLHIHNGHTGQGNLFISDTTGYNANLVVSSSATNADAVVTIGSNGASNRDSYVMFRSNHELRYYIQNDTSDNVLRFGQTTGTTIMALNQSGNVGIGEASPDEALHITSTAASATPVILLENSNANNLAPQLNLYKNSASPAANDYVGQIDFEGNDSGGNRTQYARIIAESNVVTNTSEDGILDLQVARDGTLTTALRLRGMAGGAFVGIGETNPESPLHVYHATTNGVALFESGDAQGGIALKDNSTSNNVFLLATGDDFGIQTGGVANRLTVKSTGKVGIGQDTPDGTLHVQSGHAGSVVASSVADDLIVENSDHSGITIMSPDDRYGTLGFGSPSDNIAAMVRFDEANKRMILGTVEGTAAGNLRFVVGNETTAMTIDANQNVGIGATSMTTGFAPNLTLEGGSPALLLRDTTSNNAANQFYTIYSSNGHIKHYFQSPSGTLSFATTTDNLGTGENIRLRIDGSSGNVGIGTTSPDEKLHVDGNIKATGNVIAENFVVKSTVTQMTQSFSSGSTIFGDTNDDIHQFTGSLSISGSTTQPGLHIKGNNNTSSQIRLENALGSAVWDIQPMYNDDALAIRDESGNSIVYITDEGSTGKVGIGSTNPDGTLHVHTGTAGSVTAHTSGDDLVVENNGDAGISILSPDANSSRIQFGSTNNNNIGHIGGYYNSGNFQVFFNINGANRFILDSYSRISLSNNDSGGTGGSDSTSGNTLFGYLTGANIASGGINNTLFGHGASYNLTTGDNNISIGANAGWGNHTGGGNTYLGRDAGLGVQNNANSNNVGLGFRSLRGITTGTENVAVGKDAMLDNTGGAGNVAIGTEALANNTSASENVAVGKLALYTNTTTGANTALGYTALRYNVTSGNTAVGHASLHQNTSGGENVAMGVSSAYANTTGMHNTAIGYGALISNVDGDANTAVGRKALFTFEANSDGEGENTAVGSLSAYSLSTGIGNTSIGKNTMTNATTAGYNVAVGLQSIGLGTATAASGYNTAVGAQSLYDLTSGTSNVALGAEAGVNITTGYQNTIVGRQALATATDSANIVAVGLYAGLRINSSVADGSVLVGRSAGENITNGARNTAVGYQAMLDSVGAGDNAVLGYEALKEGTTSEQNVAVGSYSLGANAAAALTGNANTALGYKSQYVAQGAANSNTSVGANSLLALTTGIQNVAVGTGAAIATDDGSQITAIGAYAMGVGNAGNYNTAVGNQSLTDVTGVANVAMGFQTAFNLTSGDYNVAIGHHSMGLGTVTGDHNVAVGHGSGYDLTSGESNVFVGRSSGANVTSGIGNVLLGDQAGMSLVSGHNNIIIGREAGKNVTTTIQKNVIVGYGAGNGVLTTAADGLVAVGASAGAAITSGVGNTAVGLETLNEGTTVSSNTAIGYRALKKATGDNNTSIGYQSSDSITSGYDNTAVGDSALGALQTGNSNVAIGRNALDASDNGNRNVAIGVGANGTQVTTHDCVTIGHEAEVSANGASNQIAIGKGTTAVGDNSVTLGNASVTAIYAASDRGATIYAAGLVEGSSMTLKENIGEIESPLDKLTKLRGVEFDYKSTKERSIGMIAEEVNEVFPELVNKNEDGEVTAMSYSRMTAVLLEAVKELSQEVKDSREEIRELKKLNNYSKPGDKN